VTHVHLSGTVNRFVRSMGKWKSSS